ncbi:hypothetical protein N665_0518s0036 [Sinapis alba]|nr:hypothetical protein N665_0518s0036 [Sinapis alba]
MKFRVSDSAKRARILRRGMWNIGNIPLVVTKWTPDELTEKPEVKSIPLWVYLKNVPMNMFSWEGLSFITSAAGHPVRLHPETASCSNFKIAKIFVYADLSKELPQKINFTKNGKSSLVEFIYPWLPARCNTCGKWGHTEKACVMNKKDETFKSVAEIIEHGMKGNDTDVVEQTEVNVKERAVEQTEVNLKEGAVEQNENTGKIVASGTENEVEEGEVTEIWSNVTPGKASRSPKSKVLEYKQVKIATRFSALEDINDNGDLVKVMVENSEIPLALEKTQEDMEKTEAREDTEAGKTRQNTEAEGVSITSGEVVTSQENNSELGREKSKHVEKHEKPETENVKKYEVRGGENQYLAGSAIGGNSNLRPSLPRNSKTNHRIVPSKDTENPGPQGRRLQFGALLETRVKESKSARIVSSVFHGWSYVNNYEFSRKGRIWFLWNAQVRVTPVFKSDQIITVSVLLEEETEEFLCSFVYAENTVERRKELWGDIKSHQDSPMFRNKEWVIVGDFNEILEGEEHSTYQDVGLSTPGMRDFENTVQYCSLSDLGYQGPKFTWCNKRDEGIICKKLDRILVNEVWLDHRAQSYGIFESGGCSDHLRGRFHLKAEAVDTQPLFQSTSALFCFSKYLKALKPLVRTLSKEKLGALTKKVKEAHLDLCAKQEKLLEAPTPEYIIAERVAAERWQRVSDIEEKLLKQRSKLHWLQVGDRNNKVFHNAAKIRETRNAIREIRCPTGNVATSQEDIKKEAERFFSDFLSFEPTDLQEITVTELQEILPFRCTEGDRNMLTRTVTEEEIREVVFKMPSNKSPGPDGFTTEFFKSSWSIIAKDFTTAVQSLFSKGFLPKSLNATILALIPKKDSVQEMRDYMPISCCNVLYKVISKIIANRLKGTLPQCIAYNQSAFVKDRLLVENLLLATEIVKDYHKEDVSPRCAMKIDIAKAFDSIH